MNVCYGKFSVPLLSFPMWVMFHYEFQQACSLLCHVCCLLFVVSASSWNAFFPPGQIEKDMVHYQDPKRQNSANAKLTPKKDLCERTLKNKVQSKTFASAQFQMEFRSIVISFCMQKA